MRANFPPQQKRKPRPNCAHIHMQKKVRCVISGYNDSEVELIMKNISIQKQSKESMQPQQAKLIIKSIHIKVKFSCRCFLEYQINQQVHRTAEIKVDSKKTQYDLNEELQIRKIAGRSPSKRSEQIKIVVKLLSNKGLSFTVGYIDTNIQAISKCSGVFDLKATQTQDIEARCTFQLRRNSAFNQFNTPRKESGELNILSNQNINEFTASEQSKNSRLEQEFQQLRDDYYKLKDKFSRYEQESIPQKRQASEYKTPQSRLDSRQQFESQLKEKNKLLQLRIHQLEKELSRNNDLFNKQKGIVAIFQSNLKDKNLEHEQLRNHIKQLTSRGEELYKQNCSLEEQKIKIMMEQLKNQKEKCNLGQYMTHMFEQVYNVIEGIFKRKITNLTSLAQNKEQSKQEQKRHTINSNDVPMKKLFYSTDFRKQQEPIENCIIQDVSISGDLSVSEIKSYNTLNTQNVMKNILKEFQPKTSSLFTEQCIETVKSYCIKIEKTVNQSVQKLFKKIMELTSHNQQYKKQLTHEKEEFQNNQQSLIDYLEQLEDGLQDQLSRIKERDIEIQRLEGVVHEMNNILHEKQKRILELESAYEKLQDEKNQIKAQLHENNYIYAIKEQKFINQIYELQNGFEKPNYSQSQLPRRLNIVNRKQTIYSENLDDELPKSLEDYYQNQVIYQSPHSKKEMKSYEQDHHEQKDFLYYDSNDDQANLRYTMLKQHRTSLVKKLREQMQTAQNVKSIDQEEQSNEQQQKVIEQEFLKVLV